MLVTWQYVLGTLLAINILVRVGTALFLTISYALHPMSATAHVSVVLFIYTSYSIHINYRTLKM